MNKAIGFFIMIIVGLAVCSWAVIPFVFFKHLGLLEFIFILIGYYSAGLWIGNKLTPSFERFLNNSPFFDFLRE